MNSNKLRSAMALHGDTGGDLAKVLGISQQSFSYKLNAKNGGEFTQGEIQIIKERYSLTAFDVDSIFFDKNVS